MDETERLTREDAEFLREQRDWLPKEYIKLRAKYTRLADAIEAQCATPAPDATLRERIGDVLVEYESALKRWREEETRMPILDDYVDRIIALDMGRAAVLAEREACVGEIEKLRRGTAAPMEMRYDWGLDDAIKAIRNRPAPAGD